MVASECTPVGECRALQFGEAFRTLDYTSVESNMCRRGARGWLVFYDGLNMKNKKFVGETVVTSS
jgi:hypothetical protein